MKKLSFKQTFILFIVLSFIMIGITIAITIKQKTSKDILLQKNLTCNFREEVYIADFIKDIHGELLSNDLIDTNIVGERNISFQYKNRYGFTSTVSFTIEVLDVTPPTIVVNNPYVVEKDSIENLGFFRKFGYELKNRLKCDLTF